MKPENSKKQKIKKEIKTDRIFEFENIIQLIQESRNRAFSKVNEELIMLNYHVGKIVSSKVAAGGWGDGTVNELAYFIVLKMPGLSGFNRRGLYRMKLFYETYSPDSECYNVWLNYKDNQLNFSKKTSLTTIFEIANKSNNQIVSSVMTQLQSSDKQYAEFMSTVITQISWTHHLMILSKTKTSEEKLFYILLSLNEKLSLRELERQLNSSVFERTLFAKPTISTKMAQLPDTLFKDPYIFEFLDLPDRPTETELEKALILNLKKFILEIGKGFTYMGSQYRLQVGNKDYHTDLLFYHRDLQCLVLFELKIQEFEPEFIGKLNFYLEALDRDVKRLNENPSIGILLCKGKDSEVVEYSMARNISPAIVADYETKLIDKKTLSNKLHQLTQQLTHLK